MIGKSRARKERLRLLDSLEQMLERNRAAIVRALQDDLHKPPLEAYAADIAPVLAQIRYARRRLGRWRRRRAAGTPLLNRPARSGSVPQPYGTALIIGPWNYPFGLVLTPLVAAIAAGNSAILKPSEYAPGSSALLASLCKATFDPADIACVLGGADTVRQAIAAEPDIVFFTGGSATGKEIMRQCAEYLIPVVLELGGCNPCIVDRTTRTATAASRIAWGKFFNAGQTCLAPNTCYVHRAAKDELIAALKETIRRFYGNDPRTSPDYARIVNRRHCERLRALLQQPHHLFAGGEVDISQHYVAPTLVEPMQADSPFVAQEAFGPILPLVPFESIEEVINDIQRRPAPLAVYLFSESEHTRWLVRNRTVSGSVCVNGTLHLAVSTSLPFGGVGQSGIGRYHGKVGFDTFSYRRAELTKSDRWEIPAIYPPYHTPSWLATRALKWTMGE